MDKVKKVLASLALECVEDLNGTQGGRLHSAIMWLGLYQNGQGEDYL